MAISIDALRRVVASNALGARFLGLSAAGKIVAVNVAVFLVLRLVGTLFVAAGNPGLIHGVLHQLAVPAGAGALLTHPWTLLTYMVTQYEVLHLVFNMIWLYWFGTLLRLVTSRRRLLAVYLYGGLAGGIGFVAVAGPLGYGGSLLGASASVMSVIAAAAVIAPRFRQQLLFVGSVELRWIAVVLLLLMDVAGWVDGDAGAHVAHLAGVAAGVVFGVCYRRGIDLSVPFRRHYPIVSVSDCPKAGAPAVSRVLEKVRVSGYSSLTASERDVIFRMSDNKNNSK